MVLQGRSPTATLLTAQVNKSRLAYGYKDPDYFTTLGFTYNDHMAAPGSVHVGSQPEMTAPQRMNTQNSSTVAQGEVVLLI